MAACLATLLPRVSAPKRKREDPTSAILLTAIPLSSSQPSQHRHRHRRLHDAITSDFLSQETIDQILSHAPQLQRFSRPSAKASSVLAVRTLPRNGPSPPSLSMDDGKTLRLGLLTPPASCSSASSTPESPDPPSSPSTASTPPSETSDSSPPDPSTSTATWSFLDHPAMKGLPKWPVSCPDTPCKRPAAAATCGVSKKPRIELAKVVAETLPLLSLFACPPIASSIASYLYGHDLLNIRCLNSDFYSLLTPHVKYPSKITYYETLLNKSLLCPRENLSTEPLGTPCSSAGGNVGPCVFCSSIICSTCLSPEIWTTKRYRYLCPPCSKKPLSDDVDYCECQSNLWVCRPCYQTKWLADIHYDYGLWYKSGLSCSGCGEKQSHKQDSRVPEKVSASAGESFFSWWMADTAYGQQKIGKTKARKPGVKSDRSRIPPPPPTKPSQESPDTPKKVTMRPVSCSWCSKMVDPRVEDYKLRPEKIARGETRGRLWMAELEQQKRKEREEAATSAASSNASSTAAASLGDIAIRMGP